MAASEAGRLKDLQGAWEAWNRQLAEPRWRGRQAQTRTGDRAYGRYQVMGANVGPWSAEVFGQPLTPEQFLQSPQAQDAVFEHKFGQYAQKYGPEGAARAWFAGEGGMNDMGRRDQLGTSVAEYSRRFQAGLALKHTNHRLFNLRLFRDNQDSLWGAHEVLLTFGRRLRWLDAAGSRGLASVPPLGAK